MCDKLNVSPYYSFLFLSEWWHGNNLGHMHLFKIKSYGTPKLFPHYHYFLVVEKTCEKEVDLYANSKVFFFTLHFIVVT